MIRATLVSRRLSSRRRWASDDDSGHGAADQRCSQDRVACGDSAADLPTSSPLREARF